MERTNGGRNAAPTRVAHHAQRQRRAPRLDQDVDRRAVLYGQGDFHREPRVAQALSSSPPPSSLVEACRTCRCYLKSVDLRVTGLAVPLVDDLATVELDLWAAERGLEKITPNVLGL